MALPVRPHPDAAPRTRPNRVVFDVVPASASTDPCQEFPPEEPEKVVVRQPVFIIVPVSSEPPSYAAQSRPHDQVLSRSQNIPADVGLFRTFFRRAVSAPRRLVVGTLLALRRLVVGALLAVRRGVVGTLLTVRRGVVGTLLALRRGVVGTLLALHRGVVGTLLAVRRGVVGTLLALRRGVVGTLLAVRRGVVGALLAVRRGVVGALLAVHRSVVGTVLALYRGVIGTLIALRRSVVGAILALHRGVMGTILALQRHAVGTLQTLHHGVMGALLALRRRVVGALLAVHRSVVGTVLALYRGVIGTLFALRRSVVGAILALRHGVMGTLLALQRRAVGTLQTLHRRAVATYVVARRAASEGARWTWRSWESVIAGTTSIGISGISRVRRLGGDVRMRRRAIARRCGVATTLLRARLTKEIGTIERFTSMAGHRLSVVGRSLYERNAQRLANANHWMRTALSTSRVRVPVTNVRLVAFAGGAAVGALAMWMFGVQPDLPRLTDRTDRSVAPVTGAVASEPSVDDSAATVYTSKSGTSPANQQTTAPSSVSASMVVLSSAMTVTSTPVGARVTINGIGWGETPVTIRHLPPGEKVVRVTKEGYESQQRIIRVPDDRRSAAVRVTLRTRS